MQRCEEGVEHHIERVDRYPKDDREGRGPDGGSNFIGFDFEQDAEAWEGVHGEIRDQANEPG